MIQDDVEVSICTNLCKSCVRVVQIGVGVLIQGLLQMVEWFWNNQTSPRLNMRHELLSQTRIRHPLKRNDPPATRLYSV